MFGLLCEMRYFGMDVEIAIGLNTYLRIGALYRDFLLT
jgi:hypothetical protein